MKKIEEYIEKFKELWANQFYKSLIKLGLYFVFMIFAVFAARASYSVAIQEDKLKNNNSEGGVINEYADITEYEAIFNVNNIVYNFNSIGKTIIKVDNKSYFLENDILINTLDSNVLGPNLDFKFWYLTPKYIDGLIKTGEELYTKNYTDGKKEVSYLVSLINFATSFEGSSLEIQEGTLEGKNIEVVITYLNNKVTNIKLDLSLYYALIDNQTSNYIVNIEYK